MEKAVRFHQTGGPEVLTLEDVTVGEPGQGEVRLRHVAVGLTFADTYFRNGTYPIPLPAGMGVEAAGVVEAIGDGVSNVAVGDKVTYTGFLNTLGAYSTARIISAAPLIKLPEGIDCETAAAMTMRGLTSAYLMRRIHPFKAGDTLLIHAAAGGVGLIVCQWARALGATVIGTVSSDEKAALAKAHGCDHAIIYTRENFAERVREITGGKGVRVVYDSIGKDTFTGSLECLRPLGMMVLFGAASGPVPPFDLGLLAKMGSLFITRPTLFTYIAQRSDLLAISGDLFDVVTSGKVKIEVNQTYALKDAAQAQIDLVARKTTGSTVLLP